MVKATVNASGKAVDVQTEIDGKGGNLVAEASSIVRAFYESFDESDKDMAMAYVAIVGGMAIDWMKDINGRDDKDGGNYA